MATTRHRVIFVNAVEYCRRKSPDASDRKLDAAMTACYESFQKREPIQTWAQVVIERCQEQRDRRALAVKRRQMDGFVRAVLAGQGLWWLTARERGVVHGEVDRRDRLAKAELYDPWDRVVHLDTGPGKTHSYKPNHHKLRPKGQLWQDGTNPSWENAVRILEDGS